MFFSLSFFSLPFSFLYVFFPLCLHFKVIPFTLSSVSNLPLSCNLLSSSLVFFFSLPFFSHLRPLQHHRRIYTFVHSYLSNLQTLTSIFWFSVSRLFLLLLLSPLFIFFSSSSSVLSFPSRFFFGYSFVSLSFSFSSSFYFSPPSSVT